ncbi:MAG TPA: hypothetical protein VF008_09780 [Niastella sp.]
MYEYYPVEDMIIGAQNVIIAPVERYGVSVFVDSDPDWVGADFVIDPEDKEGLNIFREFAAKMAAHYKQLKSKR